MGLPIKGKKTMLIFVRIKLTLLLLCGRLYLLTDQVARNLKIKKVNRYDKTIKCI